MAYPTAIAAKATARYRRDFISSRERGLYVLGETGRRRESYQPEVFPLDSVSAEKRNRRRAEDLEASKQRLVGVVVGGHVGLQQHSPGQRSLHGGIREREAFHLLARDAPVCIEVEHHRLARRCCARHGTFEVVYGLDALERECVLFCAPAARAGAQTIQRLQRIATTGRGADQ